MLRLCALVALAALSACSGRGVLVYPPAPADPADPDGSSSPIGSIRGSQSAGAGIQPPIKASEEAPAP